MQDVILPTSVTKHEENDKVVEMLKEGMKKHVQKLITYLLENNVPHEFYRLVSYLKPSKVFSKGSEEHVMKLVEMVDFKLDKVRVYEEVIVVKGLKHSLPSEDDFEFYNSLFCQHNFVELKKLFQIVITVSHSNAEAERRFSSSKLVMTENRSSMSEELFNHRKNIINGMHFFQNDLEKFIHLKICC